MTVAIHMQTQTHVLPVPSAPPSSFQSVNREVVWVDPNIGNFENSGYVHQLKKSQNIPLFATASVSRAIEALKVRKDGTTYRAITSGRGGENFVHSLRIKHSIMCEILVFCGSVDYHRTWASKYRNVRVTDSAREMMRYATWND